MNKQRNVTKTLDPMDNSCKCIQIVGNLESVKWIVYPRIYRTGPGYLVLGDWIQNPHIWLHYVESSDGLLADDDVLLSTDTRYWNIHDVQRYFYAHEHCNQILYTYQYPNLRMPTHFGDYLWRANTAMKLPSNQFLKMLNKDIAITLKKMKSSEEQMDRLIVPDQLLHLDRLDYFRRKSILENLIHVLSVQNHLQLVSFENMRCKRLEGVRLIQQLAIFNSESLKYLFLWDFVLQNENPLLINYSYLTGTGQYIPRPCTKQCFLRSLGELKHLRVLALEYSHLADGTGGALLSLLPVLKKSNFRLQLVCRETQIPGCTDARLGAGGHIIPDTAWRQVTKACPDLYLLIAFFKVRDYDNIRRFLTPSMCIREVHLQLGIDLKMKQRQDSDISCFVRHIAYRYADTMITLSIHQWRFAVFPLRRVFELMPHLVRFYYVGRVEDEVDLKRMFELISYGVCDSTGQYIPRPCTKQCFLRSLGELKHLRVLALEYSHLADGTGGALLSLLPVLKKSNFRLQLVCRETQIPGCTDARLGAGGHIIPDTAWRQVTKACPDLYLLIAFFKVRDYDNIRRFLTPSMCIREVHLQLGIDLKMKQRQDSDISCFVRHIAYRYADTMITLSIHQWRFAVFPLRRVFELMPHLVRFYYVGRVEDEVDLKRMFELISYGVCDKLKQLRIQIQDDELKRTYWQDVVHVLNKEYADIMILYNIDLCLSIYKN